MVEGGECDEELPVVLTHEQVHRLLGAIRLRRYRIPVKLIYCAGLRLSARDTSRVRSPPELCHAEPAKNALAVATDSSAGLVQ